MVEKFGVPVVLTYLGADYTAKGIKDESDDAMLETDSGAFAGRIIAVTLKTGALPVAGLVEGVALVVDGEDYTVVSAHRREDGALTRVLCARV